MSSAPIMRWEHDELTKELVEVLQQGDVCETRAFLRPIFKWMKSGVRKNGQKDRIAVEKAFAFAEWMVQLATRGDATRGIAMLPELQPNYALSTIVTASQRAGSLPEALRAFEMLLKHGYEPDVFAHTALIDVLARNGKVADAIQKYVDMCATKSQPNIVTFTTLIRAIGYSEEVAPRECLTFLAHARKQNTLDESLFLEALEMCAMRQDLETAAAVLSQLRMHSASLTDSVRLMHAVEKVVGGGGGDAQDKRERVLAQWLADGLVTQHEVDNLDSTKDDARVPGAPKSMGCLGNQTTESVRQAVVQHDIGRLAERVADGAFVSTNDFETLLHQCRKRKWSDQIGVIMAAMRTFATEGWACSTANGEVTMSAQPHLQPTSKTYVSVIDAYLVCGDEERAWEALLEVDEYDDLRREPALYRKYVRGCYLLTKCSHIPKMLEFAKQDGITFTTRMGVELARMYGYQHEEGVDVILNRIPGDLTMEKKQHLMEELVTSCGYKHNTRGVEESLRVLLEHGLQRSSRTEMAVFICCLQHSNVGDALEMLHLFQAKKLMLDIPSYDSLLREMYFKYTRRNSSFDESSRAVAMRTLYLRRALFESAFSDRVSLEQAPWSVLRHDLPLSDTSDNYRDDHSELQYWCLRTHWACSPLMFAQHFVEIITTTRDKESKVLAQQRLRAALLSTPDPFLFNLQAVVALRSLDMTYRGQGKLAKGLLSLLQVGVDRAGTAEPHHITYCFDHLDALTMHIVKELDEVVLLHKHNRTRILTFCLDALEADNLDKTIGYVVNKSELYTLETAQLFAPKLAELYVIHGVVNTLQFFKPEVDASPEMRRMFLREVIDVMGMKNLASDNTCVEGDDSLEGEEEMNEMEGEQAEIVAGLLRRAILEFKLEHESQYIPFMMPTARRAPSADVVLSNVIDNTTYLQLPLPDHNIVTVNDDDSVALACEILTAKTVHRIGVDAEWRPDRGRGFAPSRCALLQLACDSHVFLFDLLKMDITELEDLFAHVFGSDSITKIGFAMDGDITRLRRSFPDVSCFDRVENVLDLALSEIATVIENPSSLNGSVRRRRHKGLSAVVQDVLGFPLNKKQQKSDWERRPLSVKQIEYAALDAYCLLMLLDNM